MQDAVARSAVLKKPPFTIVVDTREQTPFDFPGLAVVRGTLKAGDYSLLGYENQVAVERKSWLDAWQCAGAESRRFEECVQRLSLLKRSCIVIEPSLKLYAVKPSYIERVTPATAVGRYISWEVQYGVHLHWCEDREYAARITLRFLVAFLKYHGKGVMESGC